MGRYDQCGGICITLPNPVDDTVNQVSAKKARSHAKTAETQTFPYNESIYSDTEDAKKVIQKGNKISFVPKEGKTKPLATEVKSEN